MEKQNDIVKSRIDHATKVKAQNVLDQLGLSMSDAVRLFMHAVIAENGLPFAVRVPNAQTLKAIDQAERDHTTPTSLEEIRKAWRDAEEN